MPPGGLQLEAPQALWLHSLTATGPFLRALASLIKRPKGHGDFLAQGLLPHSGHMTPCLPPLSGHSSLCQATPTRTASLWGLPDCPQATLRAA